MSLAILSGIFGLITTILWLVIGWRAMKAHESLAESTSLLHREAGRMRESLSHEEKKRGGPPNLND